MSFLKVTSTTAVAIPDLGYTVPASSTVVLSGQFSIDDLYLSADLEAAIIAAALAVEIDYGTGYTAVLAADYTNRDALAAFMNVYEITNQNNNEDLVDGSEVNASGPSAAPLHIHDARYFRENELTPVTGAGLIGADDAVWDPTMTFTTVQGFIDGLYTYLSGFDLDNVYDNDADGVMNIDGSFPLDLRSDGTNDVVFASRKIGADYQRAGQLDVSADQVILGALAAGALAQIDIRVVSNMIVDGNLTITGALTDTTVDTLNVTNANIRLRDGATGIAATDAYVEVERGTSGADSQLLWNEVSGRWQAGIVGAIHTLAWIDYSEVITGIWEMQGGAATDPSMYLTNKASAPSTNLGAAGQIALASITNIPAYYDQTRTKWLSMYREYMTFSGRDNSNNANEYLRAGEFTSNQGGPRLLRNMVLIGISGQTNGAETWTVRVRKNGSATNLASLAITAAAGAQQINTSVDFNAGDDIEVYCDGSSVNRPTVRLEWAARF